MSWFTRAAARRRLREQYEPEPLAPEPIPLAETPDAEAADPDPRAAARRLTELAHACDSFADTLALDHAMEPEQLVLRDLAGQARALSVRPHARLDEIELADRTPRLVEPDHRATHSRYGHLQLRLDRAAEALRQH